MSIAPLQPAAAPAGATIVDLDPWEYERAHDVGIGRYTANWNTKDSPAYQNNLKQEERTASTAAAICELAVAKHLCLYWPGTVWAARDHHANKHLSDVYPNVEVRRLRNLRNRVAVRRKDLGRGLNLVAAFAVGEEFRQVQILGWLPVEEAWEIGEVASYDKTGATRGVYVNQLRPIDTYVYAR